MADRRICAFGESLLRIDIGPENETKLYATGTALNFAANLAALARKNTVLMTALSTTRDSAPFRKLAKERGIDVDGSWLSQAKRMGTYYLYRTPTLRGWEVVYNRGDSAWQEYVNEASEADIAAAVPPGSHFHFDGITLCTSKRAGEKMLPLLERLRKNNCTVSFDFNFRRLLGEFAEFATTYEKAIGMCDHLAIAPADFATLGIKAKDARTGAEELLKRFKNLKSVFGMAKEDDGETMTIGGYNACDDVTGVQFQEASLPPYRPVELLGMGDAFAAAMVDAKAEGRSGDLHAALTWARLKSMRRGDAQTPYLEEMRNYEAKRAVVR